MNPLYMLALIVPAIGMAASLPTRIKFGADPSLAPVFAAGLRPSNLLGAETITCWIPNAPPLIFVVEGIELPATEGELRIKVDDHDRITSIAVIDRRNLSLAVASERALAIHTALHVPITAWEKFAAQWRTANGADYYRLAHEVSPGVIMGFYLLLSFNDKEPFQLVTEIAWQRPDKEWAPRTIPIRPPLGFESWDMSPDLKAYARGFTSWATPNARQDINPLPPAPKKAPQATQTQPAPTEGPPSSTPWSIIVALIVTAIGLLWLLVKKRK